MINRYIYLPNNASWPIPGVDWCTLSQSTAYTMQPLMQVHKRRSDSDGSSIGTTLDATMSLISELLNHLAIRRRCPRCGCSAQHASCCSGIGRWLSSRIKHGCGSPLKLNCQVGENTTSHRGDAHMLNLRGRATFDINSSLNMRFYPL